MIAGEKAYNLAKRIYPIYRSITGDGVRKTLKILEEYIGNRKLRLIEIPSGTKVFDWEVPKEWEIVDAYIEDENKKCICSFKDNCLHVVGYSYPIDLWVDYIDLNKYIYVEEAQPNVIPYVTSYYEKNSGFCMSKNEFQSLRDDVKYHLYINSKLKDGTLTLGEMIIPGETSNEILISTYTCHPSMANDNCSGLVVAAELAKYVNAIEKRKYTYRFLFIPETIGAISYLAHEDNLNNLRKNMKAGFTLSCVGDDGEYSIICSKFNDLLADKVLINCLKLNKNIKSDKIKIYSFLERGSDERQYNSPNVDLGCVGFCRTKYGEFLEYHTSLDTMEFISPNGLQGSIDVMKNVVNSLENNNVYKAVITCEPQLGKRNLYPNISKKRKNDDAKIITDILAYADGNLDLIDISNYIKQPMEKIIPMIKILLREKLLYEVNIV